MPGAGASTAAAGSRRRSGGFETSQRLRAVVGWVLVGLIAFAPIAIGTVHGWTRTVVFLGCAAALALTFAERLYGKKPIPVTVPVVAIGVAFVATAIQLVPLPPWLLARISPGAYEVVSTVLEEPGWHPITLDAGATVGELAKIGAYGAFLMAAITYASRPQRRERLVLAVAGVATLVAVLGLFQALLGDNKPLFFYQQEQLEWGSPVRGTFVNANNFGALLSLGAACTVTIGLRLRGWRIPAVIATLVINLASVLSLSRGGIAATLLAQLLTLVLDRVQLWRSADVEGSRRRSTYMIVTLTAVGIALTLGFGKLKSELARTTLAEVQNPVSKFHAWGDGLDLVRDHPWTGVGRGAFEHAFPRVSDVAGRVRFPYLENSWLQAVVDWGVPVALLLLLLAAWAAGLAIKRLSEDPLAIGAAAGLAALAMHDVVDFSVEIPGVAIPALALVAVLFGRTTAQSESGRRRFAANPALFGFPALLAAIVIGQLAVPTARADSEEFAAFARDPSVPVERVIQRATQLQRRHPSDYYLHAVTAERLAREKHPATFSWLNDAIFLNPRYSDAHLLAAEVLADTGRRSQALLEYRLAAETAPDPRPIFERVVRRYPSREDLLAACPEQPGPLALLAKWLTSKHRGADAEAVYERVVEIQPNHLRAARELVARAIDRRDAPAAKQRLAHLLRFDAGPDALRLRIRERILAGDLREAERLMDTLTDHGTASLEVALGLADALSRAGRPDAARARLDAVGRWPLDRPGRALLHEMRAEVERRDGNEHQSQWELEQARRLRNP